MAVSNSIDSINKRALAEMTKAIEGLPKEFSLTRRRNILKKGLAPFINSAISKAPKKTGDLKLSIDTKTFRNNKNYVFGGVVTKKKIRIKGLGTEVVDGFYAKFLEYGYVQVAWPKKGQTRRKGSFSASQMQKIAPKPFLRPAWDETKMKVKDTTIALVEKSTKRYLKKIKKN